MENTDIQNKYNNGKIYKITDNAYTECYIGSTVQPLASRFGGHRRNYKFYRTGKGTHFTVFDLFDKYSLENCKIELIEHYPCNDKEELRKREGYWIKLEKCVNKQIPGRTTIEHYYDNRDKNFERVKAYRLNNMDKAKAWAKASREKNKDKESARKRERVECEHCHTSISRGNIHRHIRNVHPEHT